MVFKYNILDEEVKFQSFLLENCTIGNYLIMIFLIIQNIGITKLDIYMW